MSDVEEASFWSSFTAFHLSVSHCFPTPYWPSPAAASFLLSPRRTPTANFCPLLDSFVACLSSASALAFYIPAHDLLLPPAALDTDADGGDGSYPRSFRDQLPLRDGSSGKKQQKASHTAAALPVLTSSAFLSGSIEVVLLTAPPPSSSSAASAPILRPLPSSSLSCVWPSALYLAQPSESLPAIISGLLAMLRRQAVSMRAAMSARHQSFRSFHFLPPSFPHPLVITFPTDGDEEELTAMRAQWHRRFSLQAARPLLRPINALQLRSSSASSVSASFLSLLSSHPSLRGKLLSPHLAVAPPTSSSPSSRLRLHLSSSPYLYYHYESHDTGWGCAYRTAQTIVSAIMLCALPSFSSSSASASASPPFLPSISAMQSMLRITNPKGWIGAVEVAAVLEQHAHTQCRILHLPDGADAAERSFNSQLASYFDSEGGIAMIGGGVLAYGLAGLASEEDEAGRVECSYLIVDPHYTGEDDLQAVLRGGWVGWRRRADVFLPGQFYNLCLPCMPNSV